MQTPLDTALENARADPDRQLEFYDLFLQSDLCFPVYDPDDETAADESRGNGGTISPWWLEDEGKLVLPVFDTEERLADWADRAVRFAMVGGGNIVEMLSSHQPQPRLAFNIGLDSFHLFVEDELEWLLEHWHGMYPDSVPATERTVRIGSPSRDFPELKHHLSAQFAKMPEVKAAYILVIEGRADDVPYEFCICLEIEQKADPKQVTSALSTTMANHAPDDATFVINAGDADLLDVVWQLGEPAFYERRSG